MPRLNLGHVVGPAGPQGPAGQDGAPGAPGTPGTPGADGQTPDITIGTVQTLPAGSQATAEIAGTTPNLTLNLGIPQGQQGAPGQDGQDGQDGAPGVGLPTVTADDNGKFARVENGAWAAVTVEDAEGAGF